MRAQKGFSPEIDSTDRRDFSAMMLDFNVRVVKHHLRWAVETKYNTLKSRLDMENFSGKTPVSVLQDFYATLFLSNIATAIKSEANLLASSRTS